MRWQPVDIIVALLAMTVCVTVGSIAVVPFLDAHNTLSEGKAKMFVGIVSSLVSVISMYIGARIQRRKDEK